MTDCPNAEMRDRLPDLLHERLDVSVRSAVLAHVADCVDCRDELELLGGVQRALIAQTPRIDVSYVVAALPKPASKSIPLQAAARRSTRMDWRVAAAVTLLAAGSGSIALLNRSPASAPSTEAVGVAVVPPTTYPATGPVMPAVTDSAPASVATPAAPAETVASAESQSAGAGAAAGAPDAGADTRLGDLNEQQLKSLLNDIQGLKAVPVTDPDPVVIHVNPATSRVEES